MCLCSIATSLVCTVQVHKGCCYVTILNVIQIHIFAMRTFTCSHCIQAQHDVLVPYATSHAAGIRQIKQPDVVTVRCYCKTAWLPRPQHPTPCCCSISPCCCCCCLCGVLCSAAVAAAACVEEGEVCDLIVVANQLPAELQAGTFCASLGAWRGRGGM